MEMKNTGKKIKFFINHFTKTPKLRLAWQENIIETIWRLAWISIWALLFFIKWDSKNKILKSYLLHDAKKKIKANIKKYKKFFNGEYYDFNGIKIPNIMWIIWYGECFEQIYDDIFKIYIENNDNYSYKTVDKLQNEIQEWPYCYVSKDWVEILVKWWDIVIDAWSRIGDFAAYASQKWAHTYAFEPSKKNRKFLKETAKLNENITIVPYWLGSKKEEIGFEDNEVAAGSFRVNINSKNNTIQIIKLDDYIKENKIHKVNFIKADIEWYERELLRWSIYVLKNLEPILSICTYHLDDDEVVLKKIILDANPKYKIIQMKHKLYAYIPEKHIKK